MSVTLGNNLAINWSLLEELIKERGINKSKVSKAIGRSPSFISNCRERDSIHPNDLGAIIRLLSDIKPISHEELETLVMPQAEKQYEEEVGSNEVMVIPADMLSCLNLILDELSEIKKVLADTGILIKNIAEELCK